jgi:hypothetical protein
MEDIRSIREPEMEAVGEQRRREMFFGESLTARTFMHACSLSFTRGEVDSTMIHARLGTFR